ncbi:DUF6481 family protein [Consotaella aegiceratis]|uniref:DUF6481 family protein n=1 Tax=Consotaella aegiceratis TaxID=3097961 RepID=UPI002F42C6D5
MPSFNGNDFNERRKNASESKKALLERARAKASDPDLLKRQEERRKIAEARAERAAAREAEKERQRQEEAALMAELEAEERARQAEVEERQRAEEEAKKKASDDMVSRLLADEAERKAKRDARYAARKARTARR